MALTSDQIVYLQDHLGGATDLVDAEARYARLNDLHAVIVEILQRRIADLEATPTSFSVAGEYSQNTGDNLKSLQTKLEQFSGGNDVGLSVVRIARPARAAYR